MEVSHGSKNTQTRAYCSLGIIFMCLRIAKVDEETISQELSSITFIACDDPRTDLLVGSYDVPIVFWVELGGESGRIDQITEHHGELATFRIWGARFGWRCALRRLIVGGRRRWLYLERW